MSLESLILDFQRSGTPLGPPRRPTRPMRRHGRVLRMQLPAQQRIVLDIVIRYYRVTGEACPASHIARKIARHHSTIQEHLSALFAKGWLVTANTPSRPTTY